MAYLKLFLAMNATTITFLWSLPSFYNWNLLALLSFFCNPFNQKWCTVPRICQIDPQRIQYAIISPLPPQYQLFNLTLKPSCFYFLYTLLPQTDHTQNPSEFQNDIKLRTSWLQQLNKKKKVIHIWLPIWLTSQKEDLPLFFLCWRIALLMASLSSKLKVVSSWEQKTNKV